MGSKHQLTSRAARIYSNHMKSNLRFYTKLAAVAIALSFGLRAYAEPPRDELAHAYYLLKTADHDYKGHKDKAIHEVQSAGRELGIKLEGHVSDHERQLKSDDQISAAASLLRDARDKMEAADRDKVATHLQKAIEEVDAALKAR